jgi:hypothetical protein
VPPAPGPRHLEKQDVSYIKPSLRGRESSRDSMKGGHGETGDDGGCREVKETLEEIMYSESKIA